MSQKSRKTTRGPKPAPQSRFDLLSLTPVKRRLVVLEGNWPTFTDDEVKQLATRLGNLALMRARDNSNLRSDSFEDKKEVYADSPYVLTSQIAEAAQFGLTCPSEGVRHAAGAKSSEGAAA